MSENGKKVAIGMSSEMDSSVGVYLLKEQEYDVVGATMQIWQGEDTQVQEENGGYCGLSAVGSARRVAQGLDIPYYVMNFRQEFKEHVIDYFVDEYICGRVPNPCIACSRYMKQESLLERSLDIKVKYIAAGHHARIEQFPNRRYALRKSVTAAKGQTYALYNLTQCQLAHTLMLVGEYSKEETRAIADKVHLQVASKPDSQEICFIPSHDYTKFIEENSDTHLPEGNFVDLGGDVLEHHKGITHYTIGQQKGLNLSMRRPIFVVEIRPDTNEVVIGDSGDVFSGTLRYDHLNWMAMNGLRDGEMQVTTKIRYSHKGVLCVIRELEDGMVEYVFEEPQHAITPRQAVMFYDEDYIVGGGTIR